MGRREKSNGHFLFSFLFFSFLFFSFLFFFLFFFSFEYVHIREKDRNEKAGSSGRCLIRRWGVGEVLHGEFRAVVRGRSVEVREGGR